MKRSVCVLAVLFCTIFLSRNAQANKRPDGDQLTPGQAQFLDRLAAAVVGDIQYASKNYGTPEGILYGHWRNESKALYGDGNGAGGCSAYEQYRIMQFWKSREMSESDRRRGKKDQGTLNLEALAIIARNTGRNIMSIQGSCGNSTMTHRGNSMGGALGPMQILAEGWVRNPVVGSKNIFDLAYALVWTAMDDRAKYNRAPISFCGSEHTRWQFAVRSYYGSLANSSSGQYYLGAVKNWREWDAYRGNHIGLVRYQILRHSRQMIILAAR